jgi:hypothetical protein
MTKDQLFLIAFAWLVTASVLAILYLSPDRDA